MTSEKKKILVIQVAALGHGLLEDNGLAEWQGLGFMPLDPVFPAVTCSAQASFRTALNPSGHKVPGNGFLQRDIMKPLFWEQSSRLVEGGRIWDSFRASGGSVGMLFWQQSLGESVDYLLSPAPIHKHHGGMIQSCYSKPTGLYEKLCGIVGRSFSLMHYWGPLASAKSSDWIADATASLLADEKQAPDLCLTYLPVLDYDLQRFGPGSKQAGSALAALMNELKILMSAASQHGYEVLIFGDYAIDEVKCGAVFPNKVLCEAGLFATREVAGRSYPDFHSSDAFAVVDHEIAHIYTRSDSARDRAGEILGRQQGVGKVLDRDDQRALDMAESRSGDLVLVADEGWWFAYNWWDNDRKAPDYASHVDIHSKPGYDPCELFFGWPPMSVGRDPGKIKGSHGRVGDDCAAAWASTVDFTKNRKSITGLAKELQEWLSK